MEEIEYMHYEYRKAKVAHLINLNHQEEYYYQGKKITKEYANKITKEFFKIKNGV